MKQYNITHLFFCFLLLSLISCDKFLNKPAIGLLTENEINNKPTLNSVLNAVTSSYQLLSNTKEIVSGGWDGGAFTSANLIINDIASDDLTKKWSPDGDQAWMDEINNFSFSSSNGCFIGFWKYQYEGIARTNVAINHLENSELMTSLGMSQTLREQSLGEVLFLRAFYYFNLVTAYGDVPLLLKPITGFEDSYAVSIRESKEIVYQQILKDLTTAETLLPNSKYSNVSEPWRISKGAVLAMLMKTAIYKKDWTGALLYSNKFDAMGHYSLNQHYFSSFSYAKEFTEDEVILCYNHESSSATVIGKGNAICALLGWGFFAPTTDFINSFDTKDQRLRYTVNIADQTVYKLVGDTSSIFKGNEDAPVNTVFIRYADIVLWKAEALLETGDLLGAIAQINIVRQRAADLRNVDGTPSGLVLRGSSTSVNEVKEWLIAERRAEFGFESSRLLDLKRWGVAEQTLAPLGYKTFNALYPIPQKDIDNSGGRITQNEGY